MINTIIFDLGAVLVTDVPLQKIARDLSAKSSLSADQLHSHLYPTPHWTALTSGRISEDDYWNRFLEETKLNIDINELKRIVRSELRPLKDNTAVIPLLKDAYKLAALSNHAREWSEFMQREFDFFGYFDEIIISCDVGLRKPDPRIYQLALDRIGSKPEECLFVDDKKRNTDAAGLLGMKTLTLQRTASLRDELLQLGIKLGERVI